MAEITDNEAITHLSAMNDAGGASAAEITRETVGHRSRITEADIRCDAYDASNRLRRVDTFGSITDPGWAGVISRVWHWEARS